MIHYFLARGLREADRGDFVPAHEEADMDTAVGAVRRPAGRRAWTAGSRDAPVVIAVLTAQARGLVGNAGR